MKALKVLVCEIAWRKHGRIKKAYCQKHNQSLLYAYKVGKQVVLICQVGEDELAERNYKKKHANLM